MPIQSARIHSECVTKFLESDEIASDSYFHSCFTDLRTCLRLKDLVKARLILLSHQDAFLTQDLCTVEPTQFVTSILYLCRYKYPLLADSLSTYPIPHKWYKCKCSECPCVGSYTPLLCGDEIHKFDWLTTKLEHIFFTNSNVDKLIKKLKMRSLDLIREEVLLTRILENKHLSVIFEEPSVAARRFLRKAAMSILTRPSRVKKPVICGCGGCPVWKKVYWESLGASSHVAEVQSRSGKFVATVTFNACPNLFATKHSWMKKVFSNVVSLNTKPIFDKMPTYAAFNELVSSIGITDEDLGHLCKGQLRKSYYNGKYGTRPMMLLVRVMQKGLRIHVPWHTFKDPKVFKKAQPFIDRIHEEEREEETSYFDQFKNRDLMIKIRDTELDAATYTEDFTDLLIKYKFPFARVVQEFEILPKYQELCDRASVALDNVVQKCMAHIETPAADLWRMTYQTDLMQMLEGNVDYCYKTLELTDNAFGGRLTGEVHTCYVKPKNANSARPCVHVGGKLNRELKNAMMDIRSDREIYIKNRDMRIKRRNVRNEDGDRRYMESLEALDSAARLAVRSDITKITLSELQAIEPGNLLTLDGHTEKPSALRKLITHGMFLLAKSVRASVNSYLGKLHYPFYFDANLRIQKISHGTPIGLSSGLHIDALKGAVLEALKSENMENIMNRVLEERSEMEISKNLVELAARTLRKRIMKQTTSRRLRALIALLTPRQIIAVQQSINKKSYKQIKEETSLSNGVFKRLALLAQPSRMEGSKRHYS